LLFSDIDLTPSTHGYYLLRNYTLLRIAGKIISFASSGHLIFRLPSEDPHVLVPHSATAGKLWRLKFSSHKKLIIFGTIYDMERREASIPVNRVINPRQPDDVVPATLIPSWEVGGCDVAEFSSWGKRVSAVL